VFDLAPSETMVHAKVPDTSKRLCFLPRGLTNFDPCQCGEVQMMSHVVDSGLPMKLDDGWSQLYAADDSYVVFEDNVLILRRFEDKNQSLGLGLRLEANRLRTLKTSVSMITDQSILHF